MTDDERIEKHVQRWDEIRGRSERNGCFCSDCFMMFFYGNEIDGIRFGCPRHSTPEERASVDESLLNAADRKHPLLDKVPWKDSL